MDEATSFEEWEAIALGLDKLFEYDVWRETQPSKLYDYKFIRERLDALSDAQADEDAQTLVSLLRAGLVRNLGNITMPRLFNRAYGGTKVLIDQYVTQMCLAVEHVAALPATSSSSEGWTPQAKMDLMHDTRQAFGRSTLVLQGGAIFGLSHLGVVKALHLRGLLPRIITGTATGALIAALVCIHTEDELLGFLNGDGVDLTAFSRHLHPNADSASSDDSSASSTKTLLPDDLSTSLSTVLRRLRRYLREGYFLDVNVLEACVRANVGELTFEEAFVRTKRVLNITVSAARRDGSGSGDGAGVPTLLNYLTAPHVLVWSAAVASNTSSTNFYRPATLYCKDPDGHVVPWPLAQNVTFRPYRQSGAGSSGGPSPAGGRDSPLARVAELFNVNHFIVSQARPYIAPFLRTDLRPPARSPFSAGAAAAFLAPMTKLLAGELHHRLSQLDALGLLGPAARRLLLDETIPGAHVTLVPDITLADFGQLLRPPTRAGLEHWVLRGERAVWPAVAALRARCAVEVELDRAYQVVRRRKPLEGETSSLRRPQSSKGSQRS